MNNCSLFPVSRSFPLFLGNQTLKLLRGANYLHPENVSRFPYYIGKRKKGNNQEGKK